MEAVGAGANVLAFVILGLKSAKFIHETLTSIKDGPKIVKEVAQQVLQMHGILVRIQHSQVAVADKALLNHAKTCVQALQGLETTMDKLQLKPNEKRAGRYWKRLKMFVNEKDLANIRGQITTNAVLLNTQMDLLSSNITCEIRDSNQNILKTAQAIDVSFQKMQDIIINHRTDEEYSQPTPDRTERCERSDHLKLGKDIAAILGKLQEIEKHIVPASGFTAPKRNTQASSLSEGPMGQPNNMSIPVIDQQIVGSLNRLFEHAHERKLSIDTYSNDHDLAESIMDDLQKLLRLIEKQGALVERLQSTTVPGGELEPMAFRSGLRRLDKWFGNGDLGINESNTTNQIKYQPGMHIQQTRTVDRFDVGVGQISLTIHKRKRSIQECDNQQSLTKRIRTDHSISLTFVPNTVRARMLVAATTQHQTIDSGVRSFSMLVTNRVFPAKSRVFQVVREGDLWELQRMFQDGTASPRDHDEYGASLLHYSTRQPEVCKFLIDCGLDVDHAAIAYGVDEIHENDPIFPLQMEMNDFERPREVMAAINQSRRLLLAAGADPTLNLSPNKRLTVLEEVTEANTPESLRLIWDPELIGHWAHIDSFLSKGRPLFLRHCINFGDGFSAASFKQFLNLGVNISIRNEHGDSCLHICLQNLHGNLHHNLLKEFYAVRLLLDNGADPFAINSRGKSVSDIAYGRAGFRRDLGSYPGDLWDSVLQASGFDLAQFRSKSQQRNAKYNNNYSREIFESLWTGRETECPYWDDQPWPVSNPSAEIENKRNNSHGSMNGGRLGETSRSSETNIGFATGISR